MIPLKEFTKLAMALPKARITEAKNNVSFIIDRNGNKIGDVHFQMATITIYDDYEHCDAVLERLGKYVDARKDFDVPEEPIKFEDGELSLTEQGKALYEKPNLPEQHVDKIINNIS